jgi:hypothetical protein
MGHGFRGFLGALEPDRSLTLHLVNEARVEKKPLEMVV